MITTLLPIALCLLIQSTVLLALGLIAMRMARRRGPAVESLVGRATLAGLGLALLLAGPLTGRGRSVWHVALGEPTPRRVAAPPETGRAGERVFAGSHPLDGGSSDGILLGDAAPAHAPLPAAPLTATLPVIPSNPPTTFSAPPPVSGGATTCRGVGSLWASGTALLLLWLAACQWHLSRLRRSARPITSRSAADTLAALATRPPALLTHPSARSPFLAGLRRPAIFLPTTHETDFDQTALRAILAHELAHLERRDNAWTLAARLLSALLWPQPLLWALCRRLDQAGEEACDLAVLAQDCPPRAYADCLLTLAERHPLGRRERALGAGVAPFRSSLGQRIGRILDKGTHAMSTVTTRLRLTVAALAVAAALGGAFLVSSAPAQVSVAPAQTGKPSIVGTWLTPSSGTNQRRGAITFATGGQVTIFDGTNSRQSGYYTISGPRLIVTITRIAYGHNAPLYQKPPQVNTVGFTLSGDKLIVHRPDGKVETAHRVIDFTEDMLRPERKTNTRPGTSGPNTELSQARFLAGLTPVQGPGVVVTLNDSKAKLPQQMPTGFAPPSLIHDSDVNAVVNELRAAGAEAIAINGQRLVAISSVRTAGPTILINFTPTVPPYVIKAIGNSKTLASAMNLPGGIATQIKAYDPAMFSVKEAGALTLPAYAGGSAPRYAKPVLHAAPRSTGDSKTMRGTGIDSLVIPVTGKAQRVVGYGLKMVLAGRPYCAAVKGSEAARVGIPSDTFDEVIEVNDQAASPSGPYTLALLQAPPPLHLLLRGRDNQVRSFTLSSKALLSVPPLIAVKGWEIKDLAVKRAGLVDCQGRIDGLILARSTSRNAAT